MGILANENAISAGGYPISNSLRFQSASSQYLTRTPASAGDQKTWTWSCWCKRGQLGIGRFLSAGTAGTDIFGFLSTDTFQFYTETSAATHLQTTQVFRDPSAWYHIVVVFDTTQATASNRAKIYVNGSQVTSFSTATYPAQNSTSLLNSNSTQNIGRRLQLSAEYLDGYLSEVNFIDGQALTPSSFGETNTLTGQWVAKKYTGTYGTNGFYLPFSNGTSTTTLGADSSGNGNNWTLNNFTRSAGVSDCWMYDVPSGNGSPTATQPSSNYAVLNPLAKGTQVTLTSASLTFTTVLGASSAVTFSTVGMTTGKWYCEMTAGGNDVMVGLSSGLNGNIPYVGNNSTSWGYYGPSGNKYLSATPTAYGSSYTTNDVIGIAFDADAGTLTFYKNNVSQGIAYSSLTSGPYFFSVGNGNSTNSTVYANFGQRSFAYTPPSGFKALCTANLPASTIVKGNQYMDATLWTGNQTTPRTITNTAGFSPDLVWLKSRSNAYDNYLYDSVRGAGNNKGLVSNAADAEGTHSEYFYGYLSAFESNGFTVTQGTGGSGAAPNGFAAVNQNSTTYVAWQWDAGSSTVTNTSGSISSQVRANPTAGVSVVTFTGNATAGATVGHGLGVAPKMVIYKARNNGNDWWSYHAGLTSAAYAIALNSTGAQNNTVNFFNSTAPNSSVLTLGYWNNATGFNLSTQNYVAYCFAEIAGFSKFGSYTGNGSTDGPFIYCGFRPKFVMVKNTAIASNWLMYDTQRDLYNVTENTLIANSSGAEGVYADVKLDVLSNGFKIRQTSTNLNGNGNILIYMAFAESPFQNSNSR